ncbi:hypothetical protein VQ042_19420 [Aurantimonas sp. A2-1-M11]|uniref:ribonuclease toxin HepT-like protein n=1 Tax=Aurantimonas sp. A2-1-M11 TaxID=3113712 RepID=UPI002F9267C3
MTVFKHPAFAKLSVKLERAEKEMQKIEAHMLKHGDGVRSGEWGAVSAVALGIHNVYNGVEDVLLGLANDVDDLVPSGSSMHQDILDQMSVPIDGVRPAVLDVDLYESLTELKGFRHLVRHRYGFDLKAEKVLEHLDRVSEALPSLTAAVVDLERTLIEEHTDDDDGGDGAVGGASGGP